MKKLCVAVMIAVLVCPALAEMGKVSRNDAPRYMMQTSGHFPGARITYTDSVWYVIDQDSTRVYGKAILVSDTSAGGWLYLHLVDDPDDSLFVWKFSAGDQEGYVFDYIYQPRSNTDTLPRRDFVVAQ